MCGGFGTSRQRVRRWTVGVLSVVPNGADIAAGAGVDRPSQGFHEDPTTAFRPEDRSIHRRFRTAQSSLKVAPLCLRCDQYDRLCRGAIPTGTTALLQVRLHRLGDVAVNNGADIALVDAHAVGTGGAEDAVLTGEKPLLGPPLLLAGEARVIKRHVLFSKGRADNRRGALRIKSSCAKNDRRTGGNLSGRKHRKQRIVVVADRSRAATPACSGCCGRRHRRKERTQAVAEGQCRLYGVADVLAIGIAANKMRSGLAEKYLPDAIDHMVRGGSGKGGDQWRSDRRYDPLQLEVGRSEGIAPLGDAVRFVHHEMVDDAAAELFEHWCSRERFRVAQQEIESPRSNSRIDLAACLLVLAAAKLCHGETGLANPPLLVAHEANQRIDHQRRPRQQRRR